MGGSPDRPGSPPPGWVVDSAARIRMIVADMWTARRNFGIREIRTTGIVKRIVNNAIFAQCFRQTRTLWN